MLRYITLCILMNVLTVRCHCPHMMGHLHAKKEGPQAPGSLPPGDKGWDWDEPSGAPGSMPEEHFIQTTFIHRSNTASEKAYAERVAQRAKIVREKLKKEARVTIDNENIECSGRVEDHYRCSDYSPKDSYHFLVVEDASKGAAVYSLDKKYNDKSDGAIEMALLDALSRHSPNSLTSFVSPEYDKEVGFVRALSNKELQSLSSPSHSQSFIQPASFSPLELQLLEPSLLELRDGAGLEDIQHRLTKYEKREDFEKALSENKHLFVLFWSNVHSISLHSYHLWAKTSKLFSGDAVMSHVECHKHAEFCEGLNGADFYTIVAYKDGENIGSTNKIKDEKFYLQWMNIMLNGPLVELRSEEEYNKAKKGSLLSAVQVPVTIGVFPSESDTSFKHFSIAADKLFGRYYIAYYLKDGAQPSITSYRPLEKKRRTDYEGRFDPATITSFITRSTLPTIMDISYGFTTDVLFRQPRAVLILSVPATFKRTNFEKFAAGVDASKQYVITTVKRDSSPLIDEVLSKLGVKDVTSPLLILLNKDKVYQLEILESNSEEEIWEYLKITDSMEPDFEIPAREAHPLRLLQAEQVHSVFGKQNIMLLPDHTLFKNSPPSSIHPPMSFGGGGGCPFMAGGGAAHDEL